MINHMHERFINVVDKIDKIDIVLKFKPSTHFKEKLFFIQKNDML